MTEAEYALATDLQRLYAINQLLRELMTEPHTPIPHEERAQVIVTVEKWREAINKLIKIKG